MLRFESQCVLAQKLGRFVAWSHLVRITQLKKKVVESNLHFLLNYRKTTKTGSYLRFVKQSVHNPEVVNLDRYSLSPVPL